MSVNRKNFDFKHLPLHLQEVSKLFYYLVKTIDELLPETDEKEVGIRKLLEAKDCMVRAKLETIAKMKEDV